MEKEDFQKLMLEYFNCGFSGALCVLIPKELTEYESEFLACFKLGSKVKDSL